MINRKEKKVFKTFITAFGLSLLWTFLISFVGLIQFWILIIYAYVIEQLYEVFHKSIFDGVLLFFIMAVVTSIAIDYAFDKHAKKILVKKSAFLDGAVLFFFPLVTIIFVVPFYLGQIVFGQTTSSNSNILFIQILATLTTIIYALIIKLIIFLPPAWNKK